MSTNNPPSAQNNSSLNLLQHQNLFVKQIHEVGEWIGFETRNKYEILDTNQSPIGFAAEQQKGLLGFLARQFLGHWRSFEIHFFSADRARVMTGYHPFRFFFQRLEVYDQGGHRIGAIQQRLSLLSKRFDVENSQGMTIMEVASPIWRLWTFPFVSNGATLAAVKKKWSGLFSEAFTDRDTFQVEYQNGQLNEDERKLVLAAALFIDLQYFERKAR